ncbi:NBS-LRR disease resistance protein, partial [Trifolium medium]|nr:NBS-LRR disease resistance protein [Trifolium medium]
MMALVGSFLFSMAESIIAQLASQTLAEASQVLGVYNDLQHFTQTLSYIKA